MYFLSCVEIKTIIIIIIIIIIRELSCARKIYYKLIKMNRKEWKCIKLYIMYWLFTVHHIFSLK